ncbi:exodeoxyribonuclease VII large subunit [Alginatibacterium sediminis]|uniref:exodeoxyribonuclease VII large subunit n=1 Tax=Alginatibacterium sediminis TaxID=2164068 RepID=UPI001313FEFA|nr:exodeoxyribonuclease VII large subunit [Alginatibacterium sediminis]
MNPNTAQAITVSQLNHQVRSILEGSLQRVFLQGEISNLTQAYSGHWYFSLKDSKSQVRCAMFRSANSKVSFQPVNGMEILLRGRISVYEPRGEYQILVDAMQNAGDGALQAAFEALKLKLAAAGLFATSQKQALPQQPQRIGIISSAKGAAIHDILSVLKRRAPHLEVIIYPSLVQGTDAPLQLQQMLQLANQRQEVDVLLLTRGGGSSEDLHCFNDESLAYAIFNSTIPVISAVGHEVDVSISDFVADMRAPTPSAAAELVSQNAMEISQRLSAYQQNIKRLWQWRNQQFESRLHSLQQRLALVSPANQLQQQQQRLDSAQMALTAVFNTKQQFRQHRLEQAFSGLRGFRAEQTISLAHERLSRARLALEKAQAGVQSSAQNRLAQVCQQLEQLSPLAVLNRGYSMVQAEDGSIIRDSDSLYDGQKLRLDFAKGHASVQVLERSTKLHNTDSE